MHFHDTRHEAITRLASKLDVLSLARVAGHRDIRMSQAYYNETAEELAARLDQGRGMGQTHCETKKNIEG